MLILWPNREQLTEPREDPLTLPRDLDHLSSLCREYEPQFWWFEISECLRKYVLVSVCVAIFPSHPSSAMFMAVMVCVWYILFFQEMSPYVYDIDDVLCYLSMYILLLIFMLAVYTRFSNLLSDATSEDIVGKKEIFAFKELVGLAAALVTFVFAFAFLTAMMEAYMLSQNPGANLIHHEFFGCVSWREAWMERVLIKTAARSINPGATAGSNYGSPRSVKTETPNVGNSGENELRMRLERIEVILRANNLRSPTEVTAVPNDIPEMEDESSYSDIDEKADESVSDKEVSDHRPRESDEERAKRIQKMTKEKLNALANVPVE